MEPAGAALRRLADELLDEPVPYVAGIRRADGIELDDRPLVAEGFALDPDEPGEVAVLLVDEQEVVRSEGAQREPEQAEDADRRAADG
jgi:hypothetical protein